MSGLLCPIRVLCLLLVALGLAGCYDRPTLNLTGSTMGTTWSLKGPRLTKQTHRLVQAHLDAREALLSHWRNDSVLSRFNQNPSTDWQPVPLELVQVVQLARRIALQTEGVLDITLAPVIEQFGFAPRLSDQPAVTGWPYLQDRLDPPALRKKVANLRLNVACVTEGFVVDELVALLKEQGYRDFLLEVGGEIAAIGHAPGGGPWQIGVQSPDATPGTALQMLPLSDQCAATSGSYRQRRAGRTHLIDPRTQQPIAHSLVSVTVLHDSCAVADGFATALMILGPQEGRRIAEKQGLRVIWIEETP